MHADSSLPTQTGRLICVFGVSGVGKTTTIEHFTREHPDWRSLQAGQLLSRTTSIPPTLLRVASRSEIEHRQHLLAELVATVRAAHPQARWLLDAHSIIANDYELTVVPLEAIARLNPAALIFLFDDPARIQQQREADPRKVRPRPSLERIAFEQNLAYEACLRYSTELQLKLYRIKSGDFTSFASALMQA